MSLVDISVPFWYLCVAILACTSSQTQEEVGTWLHNPADHPTTLQPLHKDYEEIMRI